MADGLDTAGAGQRERVVFSDTAVHHRRTDAVKRDRGHVGSGQRGQLVAHPVRGLTGMQLDVTANQLGVGQRDQVVRIELGQGIGIGTGHGGGGKAVGIGRQACRGLRGQLQDAAEVAQLGTIDGNVRAQASILGSRRGVERSQANRIDTHLIHRKHIGGGFHTEHTVAAGGLRDQLGALAHVDARSKALRGVTKIGGRAQYLQAAQATAKGLH